jgi:2-polyprenyl-3-methyl-5-hydroxy-6-metoxy-1,4-benzoquinol methylase
MYKSCLFASLGEGLALDSFLQSAPSSRQSPSRKRKSMSEKNTPADPYMLSRTPEETQRLQLQARFVNPFLPRLFEQARITTGMRVLDVGCGAGDVTLLLADQVGTSGVVVGIDNNPALLETAQARAAAAGHSNVSFLLGNLESIELDTTFDAVVGRFILVHVSSPAAVLRRLAMFLRPGGVIAFQEPDSAHYTKTAAYPPAQLHSQVLFWQSEVMRRAGLPPRMGMSLYTAFLDAGLPAPHLHGDMAMMAGPDWLWYNWRAETVRSELPAILKFGIATEEEVGIDTLAERLREEAIRERIVVEGMHVISAWTTLESAISHP